MVKEVMLGVRVEREVYEALKIMARARRVKTSVIVREALSMYLAAAFFFAYPRLAGVFSEAKPTAVRTPPSPQQQCVPTAVETTPIGTPAENAAPAPAPQAAVLTAVETPPEASQPQPAAPTAVGSKEGERRRKVTLRSTPRPSPLDAFRLERERLEKGLLRARLAEEKRRELLKRKLQL